MNQKDYALLAKWINDNYLISSDGVKYVLEDMADQLAQLLELNDPEFNYHEFRLDCHKHGRYSY